MAILVQVGLFMQIYSMLLRIFCVLELWLYLAIYIYWVIQPYMAIQL